MPPKKVVAKGAKGKAKAVEKEEKKQAKVAKTAPKGKLLSAFFHTLNIRVYIVRLYYENHFICNLTQWMKPYIDLI